MYNNELYHYGVLGMKWGVRKDRGSTGSGRSRKATAAMIFSPVGYATFRGGRKLGRTVKRNYGPVKTKIKERRAVNAKKRHDKALDVRTSAKYTYRQRKILSDSELRSRINRLNMEKQLKDLANNEGGFGPNSDPSFVAGKKALQKGMGVYGAKVLADAAVPGMGSYVKMSKK